MVLHRHQLLMLSVGALCVAMASGVLVAHYRRPAAASSTDHAMAESVAVVAGGDLPGVSALPITPTSTGPTSPRTTSTPAIQAVSYLVTDLTTNQVLAARQPTMRWPLASLTKLITAAVVLENGTDLAATYTIAPVPGGDPSSSIAFVPGSRYGGTDVLRALLIASSNEAAETFAALGDRTAFVASMNELLARWDVRDTYVVDPTGLSASNQSTAEDLTRIIRMLANEHAIIFTITRSPSVSVTERSTGGVRTLTATHQLTTLTSFRGGKTGYTDEARGNLVSRFAVAGHDVLIVVLGTNDRFGDTRRLLADISPFISP